MKYLAPKLKHRLQILEGYQDPTKFGMDTRYRILIRVWAQVKNENVRGTFGVQPVRSVNIGGADTHQFLVRYNSIISSRSSLSDGGFDETTPSYSASKGMGRAFTTGYSTGYNSEIDMNPVKIDMFVFLEEGSRYKGRLFKINRVIRDENYKEYFLLHCSEVEERGTGGQV